MAPSPAALLVGFLILCLFTYALYDNDVEFGHLTAFLPDGMREGNSLPTALLALLIGAVSYHLYMSRRMQYAVEKAVKDRRQQAAKDRLRAATYPGWVPNGWYKLCDSKDVTEGQVREIQALGRAFAVFRAADGSRAVSVLDAHCPHMGANLAVGGKVVGDCIQCPFHHWQISGGDGSVKHIPYDEKIPSKAKTRSWPCREFIGMVLVYFDAEGRDPPYEPVPLPEIESGAYPRAGAWKSRDIRMHIMEFTDNSGDTQHFPYLHSQMTVPWTDITLPFFSVHHEASWDVDTQLPHVAYFSNKAVLRFRGTELANSGANARITFVGPAGIVYFRFLLDKMPDKPIYLIQTHTPKGPMQLQTEFSWFRHPDVSLLLASYVVNNWLSQWKNDIEVWENKIHLPGPVLAKHDGPVMKTRRWGRQFWSESSKSVGKGYSSLDW